MSRRSAVSDELIVLDAHGVVFTREFPDFVRGRAIERGDDPDDVWARWHGDLRIELWEGRITPNRMWPALFPGDSATRLTADLESRYGPGPLFDLVAEGGHRLWLLSNHHSEWLLPRLARFDITDRFERVLVSDRIGAAKPHPRSFEQVAAAARLGPVRLIDDSPGNVAAARRLGIDAMTPDDIDRASAVR